MKDIYGYGEKMARNGGKMVIYESQILRLTLYLVYITFLGRNPSNFSVGIGKLMISSIHSDLI